MPLTIQRVPRALGQVLSIFGGQNPNTMGDEVRGTIDLLQFYGLTQLQVRSAADAALVEGANITLTVPNGEHWLLYSAAALLVKTATQTALRGAIMIGPDASNMSAVVSRELGPFGATETGGARVVFYAPYPRLLTPASLIRFNLEILGTDANANCLLSAQVGVLG